MIRFLPEMLLVVIGEAVKLNVMDYESEWEDEEAENELVIERAESERWELRLSKTGFGLTVHGILHILVTPVK